MTIYIFQNGEFNIIVAAHTYRLAQQYLKKYLEEKGKSDIFHEFNLMEIPKNPIIYSDLK